MGCRSTFSTVRIDPEILKICGAQTLRQVETGDSTFILLSYASYTFMWAKLKKFFWEWRGVWLVAPCTTGSILLLRLSGGLQFLEWQAFDRYLRSRPQLPTDERIVIVGIDEEDLRNIGQGIIPDRIYARVLQKLKAQNPRAIGLDVYRDLPVPPGTEELNDVFESTDNLIGIEKVVGDRRTEAVAAPPALKNKTPPQVGANDLVIDGDNRVRRGLLYLSDRNGEIVYSFSLYLALLYLESEGISPQMVEGTSNWELGQSLFAPFHSNDGGYIRADDGGFQMLIDYRGIGRFETVSLTDILEDRVPSDWARDRIVLIGAVGESFNDSYFTPYSGGVLTSPKPMAGVEVHAAVTSQILRAAGGDGALFHTWSEPIEGLWLLFWSGIGAVIAWNWRKTSGRRAVVLSRAIAPVFVTGILLGTTYVAFLEEWWLPVVPPFLGLAGSTLAITGYMAYTASKIRKTFGRYLTDEVVANLLESPEGLKLGGKRQKITVLASDLRGFTALSERMPPEEVVTVLNLYLKAMLEVIRAYQGTIDKFLGDGILVHFGTPAVGEDDAERAVACAIAMQLSIQEVNQKLAQLELPLLEMGIGLHTGECVVGNIGSELHAEYTVIGNHVNLAFRIETYCTGNQILISEQTFKEVGSANLRVDSQKEVKPKGVKEALSIYEIGALSGKYNLFLPKDDEQFIRLREEIPLLYLVVEGKQVSDKIFKGSIVGISVKGVEIRVEKDSPDSMPPPLSNLKVNLLQLIGNPEISEDVYAKVLDRPASKRTFYVHLTYKPPAVATALRKILTQALQQLEQ
ncbi:MAG: adenylate/guanylate cyclase domain-containing protein [Cyanobacteriota bacterium]|nr:adenylate/guanylate cyclase domain-containing protein [Cyanobacteriota bacterium]